MANKGCRNVKKLRLDLFLTDGKVTAYGLLLYNKKRLSLCRKNLKGADDDEGCQTGVGRSSSRKGAGLEQEQGRSKNRAGTG